MLLAYEAFVDLPVVEVEVATPLTTTRGNALGVVPIVIPILRAGLGMAAAVQQVVGDSRLCLLGLRRNEETLLPEVYLDGLPKRLDGETVVLCDPMLATGGSLCQALELLHDRGARTVRCLSLLAAPEGIALVHERFPDTVLTVAAIDERLDERGYIVPGLGDAGDRQFGAPTW